MRFKSDEIASILTREIDRVREKIQQFRSLLGIAGVGKRVEPGGQLVPFLAAALRGAPILNHGSCLPSRTKIQLRA